MTQLLIYLVIGGLSLAGIRYRKTRSVEAHGHRHPLSTQCLCLLQLPGVAVVEGIVFGNDPGKLIHCEIYIVHTEITCVSFHLWAGCTKKHGYFVEPFARLRLENPWNLLYNISRNL